MISKLPDLPEVLRSINNPVAAAELDMYNQIISARIDAAVVKAPNIFSSPPTSPSKRLNSLSSPSSPPKRYQSEVATGSSATSSSSCSSPSSKEEEVTIVGAHEAAEDNAAAD